MPWHQDAQGRSGVLWDTPGSQCGLAHHVPDRILFCYVPCDDLLDAAWRITMRKRVLLVEDEEALVALLRYNFEAEGYEVTAIMNGDEAAEMAESMPFDIIVLDWMLPGISGIELCRRFRRSEHTRHVPILMLTARGEEEDRVRGLTTGADDYVVKPFSVPELLARMQALLRRANPAAADDTLTLGPLTLHRANRTARWKQTELPLSSLEFDLLAHFMENAGRVLDRDQLLDAVWGMDAESGPRSVDVAVSRLRKMLTGAGAPKDLIRTVYGIGYVLSPSAE